MSTDRACNGGLPGCFRSEPRRSCCQNNCGTCEVKNQCLNLHGLHTRFEIRLANIQKKTVKFGLTPPDKEALWDRLKTRYEEDFTCEYCQRPLMIKDPVYPHGRSFSFDHKKSCFSGGTNDTANFAIICHECNITKGTMDSETFKAILVRLPEELRKKMFEAGFASRLANKLEREQP